MVNDNIALIVSELDEISKKIDENQLEIAVDQIVTAPEIFVTGAGRAGAMMQCFTKRLMHANLKAYFVGETTTPSAHAGDLLIIGSGSGETESLVVLAKKAKKMGLSILLFTTNDESSIAKIADNIVLIPATTPKSANPEQGMVSKQPMANLFEQMLLVCVDALSISVASAKKMDAESMFARHANLE